MFNVTVVENPDIVEFDVPGDTHALLSLPSTRWITTMPEDADEDTVTILGDRLVQNGSEYYYIVSPFNTS